MSTPATSSVSSKRKFTFRIRVVGLKQHKDQGLQQKFDRELKISRRCFRCDMCGIKCASTKEINAHYKNTHKNIQCKKCIKEFSSPYLLKKHMYDHGERKYKCDLGDVMLTFRSQLSDHSTTHAKDTRYWCQRAGCSSHFGRARDLKAHLEMHDTEPMKCPHCDYTGKDKRNF